MKTAQPCAANGASLPPAGASAPARAADLAQPVTSSSYEAGELLCAVCSGGGLLDAAHECASRTVAAVQLLIATPGSWTSRWPCVPCHLHLQFCTATYMHRDAGVLRQAHWPELKSSRPHVKPAPSSLGRRPSAGLTAAQCATALPACLQPAAALQSSGPRWR